MRFSDLIIAGLDWRLRDSAWLPSLHAAPWPETIGRLMLRGRFAGLPTASVVRGRGGDWMEADAGEIEKQKTQETSKGKKDKCRGKQNTGTDQRRPSCHRFLSWYWTPGNLR